MIWIYCYFYNKEENFKHAFSIAIEITLCNYSSRPHKVRCLASCTSPMPAVGSFLTTSKTRMASFINKPLVKIVKYRVRYFFSNPNKVFSSDLFANFGRSTQKCGLEKQQQQQLVQSFVIFCVNNVCFLSSHRKFENCWLITRESIYNNIFFTRNVCLLCFV